MPTLSMSGAHENRGLGPGTHLHLAKRRNGWSRGQSNARPSDQSRHTLGGRAVKKFNAGSARVDATMEGYYQFGEIADQSMGGCTGRCLDIEAYAFHFDAGLTLPVPMAPRLSAEYNTASGEVAGDGKFGGFDQLYPTNHIHFGYMDRMSWKNMNHSRSVSNCGPTRTATSK